MYLHALNLEKMYGQIIDKFLLALTFPASMLELYPLEILSQVFYGEDKEVIYVGLPMKQNGTCGSSPCQSIGG